MHFLIVEDTADVASAIASRMESAGHACDIAPTVADAELYLMANDYDAVILDINLPDGSGTGILRNIRTAGNPVPVLVLTARFAIDDKIDMLDIGADDYMVKPFSFEELSARLEALLRRPAEIRPEETSLACADLELDLISRTARRGARQIDLLPREFQMLEYLMRRKGRVVTRTMLLEGVWDYRFDPKTNVIDVHISRLRRKIDAEGELPLIRTVRGSGYTLSDAP